jgi:hypothetical protein
VWLEIDGEGGNANAAVRHDCIAATPLEALKCLESLFQKHELISEVRIVRND